MDKLIAFVLDEYLQEQGLLQPGVNFFPREKMASLLYFFGQRRFLEELPRYKQLIPYCIVYETDPRCNPDTRILTYRRTKQGNEKRLHEKTSIGFGGHVDLTFPDAERHDPAFLLLSTCIRELDEELPPGLYNLNSVRFAERYIYDASDAVNSVHWGVLFTAHANPGYSAEKLASTEECEKLSYRTLEELKECSTLERWSRLVVDSLVQVRRNA